MVARVQEHGGLVSYRDSGDGTQSPYELNCTWYSALNRDGEPLSLQHSTRPLADLGGRAT